MSFRRGYRVKTIGLLGADLGYDDPSGGPQDYDPARADFGEVLPGASEADTTGRAAGGVIGYDTGGSSAAANIAANIVARAESGGAGYVAHVTGNDVALREGPGTGARVLGRLSAGLTLMVTGAGVPGAGAPSWLPVNYEGLDGFVAAQFVAPSAGPSPAALVEPPSSPGPAPGPTPNVPTSPSVIGKGKGFLATVKAHPLGSATVGASALGLLTWLIFGD